MKKLLTPALLGMLLIICSFDRPSGGEGFEIAVNNKVVLRQFGEDMKKVNEISISHPDDEIRIKYFHCGRIGKTRKIRVTDGKNVLVRQWQFADSDKDDDPMKCKAADLMTLKAKTGNLKVFYSSSELTTPRLLVTIRVSTAYPKHS